jgi:hypothetical protein
VPSACREYGRMDLKKRRGWIKWAMVTVVSLVVLALVVLCPGAFLYTRRLDQARAEYEPPTVYITVPTSGVSAPTGSGMLVAATAVGRTPITRVELWVADVLVETLESDDPEGTSNFDASFQWVVSEGANLLYVRAVNSAGIIGQSTPLSVFGELLQPGDIVSEITVQEGQSLEEIAGPFEIDPQTLQELNPDLGGREPAPGSTLTVPAPETEEDDVHVAPPSVGPAVPASPPGTGTVPMPGSPPLQPIQPSPHVTSTVPLPVIVGSVLPQLAIPVFTPPTAPTGLQGYAEDCMVHLRWNDNAGDELRYEVWMAPMGGSSQLFASLQPAGGGPAWVKFPAPQTGGLSFWVEAVNLVGKQPSNIVWVEVESRCPTAAPDRLQVEVVDMSMDRGYDKAYCYVSFENAPEVRMPGDDSEFVQVSGGQGNIASWAATSRKFVLPIPADDSLEMTGQCWGWSGQSLSELGTFSGAYARETWDGTRRPLQGNTYEIGLSVQPSGGGDTGTRVAYSYQDSTIPVPFNLREEKLGSEPRRSLYPKQWEQWFQSRRLRWDWTGSEQLTGFTIFLNGTKYKTVSGANVRETNVTLPALYDQRIRWQVAADAGEAQSPLSQELAYDLPKSRAYLQVKFDTIRWLYTCDGCCCGDCSTCEAYGWLSLRMGGHEAFKLCAYLRETNDVKCGNTYAFSNLCSSDWILNEDVPDVLILPFDKESKNFTFDLWVHIYDDDGGWSGSDTIADYRLSHSFSSLQHAQTALGCGKQFQERDSSDDGSSGMSYTLTVFPNACGQEPTYLGKDWGVHH